MRSLHFTDQAEADLDEIWLYIAKDSSDAADRFVRHLRERCARLTEAPRLGRARPELSSQVRRYPVASYIVFYRVSPQVVEVLRVLHGARDLDRLFEERQDGAGGDAGNSVE